MPSAMSLSLPLALMHLQKGILWVSAVHGAPDECTWDIATSLQPTHGPEQEYMIAALSHYIVGLFVTQHYWGES